MASTSPSQICAHCGKAAERACSGCKDVPAIDDDIKPIYYCSPSCQKEDWQHHKTLCKRLQTRKLFYRAGSILQEIFYMYREKMFDKLIARIDKSQGRLIIHEGRYNPLITADIDCLIPFPANLCQTEEDKKSVLVHLACDDASAWLHDILKYTLAGIASNIVEVRGVVQNKKLEIIAIDVLGNLQNTDFEHEFLKIKLVNGGEEYGLDLSSAQFGYYEPIVPWRQYLQTRISKLVSRQQFNYPGGARDRLVAGKGDTDVEGLVAGLNMESSRALVSSTKEWESETNMTILKMLKLPHQEFKMMEKQLVDFIADNLEWYLTFLREKAGKAKAKFMQAAAGESSRKTN
ncbi:hypothetical protein BKA64DRAFT_711727 [Cadophora sp. MPI-SDFR-AT-0126]|nr:hypothetical protein BKA64DRAFT_711727 [Leotiomycetes sp. MPI-SDFR-AT-0126]